MLGMRINTFSFGAHWNANHMIVETCYYYHQHIDMSKQFIGYLV